MYYRDDYYLNYIYDKTAGYCRYCGKKIAWKNYGVIGARGAWEVDHNLPVSRGGSDRLRNLFPACISCNRSKSDLTGNEFFRYLDSPYYL